MCDKVTKIDLLSLALCLPRWDRSINEKHQQSKEKFFSLPRQTCKGKEFFPFYTICVLQVFLEHKLFSILHATSIKAKGHRVTECHFTATIYWEFCCKLNASLPPFRNIRRLILFNTEVRRKSQVQIVAEQIMQMKLSLNCLLVTTKFKIKLLIWFVWGKRTKLPFQRRLLQLLLMLLLCKKRLFLAKNFSSFFIFTSKKVVW